MYVLEWRIFSALTRGLFWCLFPELRSNEVNKYQKKTQVSAETFPRESTYIILFLTRHNESINDDKNDFAQGHRVSLARFSLCWLRHNRLLMTSQWPDNCDVITWIVISNSLDIDFIHGNIPGRSCQKFWSLAVMSDIIDIVYVFVLYWCFTFLLAICWCFFQFFENMCSV